MKPVADLAPRPGPAHRPLLTIAIPTYNRARYLDRSFEHHLRAFEAAGIDFELFVSDDCSPDDTQEVMARWAHEPRLRTVRHETNIGAYGNFLYTYRQARGEFMVWVGDDDLLIPEQVLAYVERLRTSPELVMIQCPWILVDETRDGAEIGTFYRHDKEELFERGEHGRCLDFILDHHVFPEWFLLRTSVVNDVIEAGSPHAYHYFTHVARALTVGQVLFAPRPYARVTAVSKGDNSHSGNSETMIGWDRYRGGLEYFASFIPPEEGVSGGIARLARITDFTLTRMKVAVRLHVDAGNWNTAYQLDRRMRAYGVRGLDEAMRPVVAGLAAIEAIIEEARAQNRHLVVLDDLITDDTLESLRPALRAGLVRRRDTRAAGRAPKAYALLRPPAPDLRGPDDIVIDLAAAFARYPA